MVTKSLLEYLQEIPSATRDRLYFDSRTCVALYRLFCPTAQYILQRLLLTAGATPFPAVRSWHPSTFKTVQNPALLVLKNLGILRGQTGEVWLHEEFRQSLLRAFSGDLDNDAEAVMRHGSVPVSREWLCEYAEEKWEALLYMLVTGQSMEPKISNRGRSASNPNREMSQLMQVLLAADLAISSPKTPDALEITSRGFQFLLAPRATQLWSLLIQYFVMAEASGLDLVGCVMAVCQLSLMRAGALVGSSVPPAMADFLKQMGLIYETRDSTLLATSLVQQLGPTSANHRTRERYIIIETNYKVYAYTNSPLQIAILGLFVKLKDRFANMVHGQLCGPSVAAALAKGITADQLIAYLREHLHPHMLRSDPARPLVAIPPVIEDQLHLWEGERNRLRTADGYLYRHFGQGGGDQTALLEKTVVEAQRLNALLYVNYQKRMLIVKAQAHPIIKSFLKTEQHQ